MSRMGIVGFLVASCFSCSFDGADLTARFSRGHSGFALRPISDCGEVDEAFKNQMAERMETELNRNLESALDWVTNRDEYCACWYGYYDEDFDYSICDEYWVDGDYAAGGRGGPPSPESREGASEYSTTNTQVVGVDEADFVKNDGSYVYIVSGDELLIFDAWPAPEAHAIASATIEGTPTLLYVEADHALVYSYTGGSGYCEWDGYNYVAAGGELKITVLDITERDAPVLDREIYLSGSYINSRRIGSAVHTVASFRHVSDAMNIYLPTWPEDFYYSDCEGEITAAQVVIAFEVLRQQNLATIEALEIGSMLPSARSIDYEGGIAVAADDGLFVDCENFFEPPTAGQPGYLSVISLNIEDDASMGAATILGTGGEVYASHQNLYVAAVDRMSYHSDELTLVHKFAIDAGGGAPSYRASGGVAGRLINQFAMDEHEGRLRLATTEGYLPSPDCTNNVFVLEEQALACVGCYCDPDDPVSPCCDPCGEGVALNVVGEIRGIAPTEDIRSVRFDGDRGFMVTFKKTDPLFAFDLSNPRSPHITGELKIPGFSTYMHFMDEDHLLTIGFDADDQGSFAWFTGVMLQIFDVSDMSAPTLAHKEIIGTRGTTSDATDDHMAFNYFRSRSLLAIPMGICEESSGGGSYGNSMTFNGLLIYRVDADNGFTLVGGVDHRDPGGDYSSYDCYNWWQNPNSQVKRSIFMDDFVFSISPEQIKVNELTALDVDLVTLPLPQASEDTLTCYDR